MKNHTKENKLNILLICILIGFVSVYLFKLGDFGLFNVDEPFHAEVAREIVESNNWIVPKFNYEAIYDKPILFYWLEALSMKIFGINEFSARLPSACSAIFCSMLLAYLLRKLYGITPALISVLVLMSSLQFIAYSKLAVLDMLLTNFITCSIISFFLGYIKINNNSNFSGFNIWYLLGFIFLGLGILSKGPVAIVIVGMTLLPFFILVKKLYYLVKNPSFWFGFILFLVLVLPWYLAVHYATNGEFTKIFFGVHNFDRFTSVVAHHSAPLLFFIPVISVGFMPWIFCFPQAIYFLLKRNKKDFLISTQEQFYWLSLWWFLIVFIFFTVSKTKLISYILPLYPPLSILVGLWLWQVTNKKAYALLAFLFVVLMIYFSFITVALPILDKRLVLQLELRTFSNYIKKENIELITLNAYKPGFVFYTGKKIFDAKNLKNFNKKIMENKRYAFVTDKENFKKLPQNKIYLCDLNTSDRYMFFTNYPRE